jgi:hypothetical protein
MRKLDATRAWLTPATAVLARNAPATDLFGSTVLWVPTRWTARGVRHSGEVPVAAASPAGTSVETWLDAVGKVQQQPLTPNQLLARVTLTAATTPLVVALGMLLGWRRLRWLLDRHRLAAWDSSWSIVGPSWTR